MADATVVCAQLDAVDPRHLASLSDDERARAARFIQPLDARLWASARAVLRLVLGAQLGLPPREVALTAGPRGQLALGAELGTDLAFNLSHGGGLVLVATSPRGAVGVDVEPIRPVPDMVEVARRVLRPEARAAIERAEPAQRAACFFRAWVRHEARLKCRGTGIVEPADDDGRTDDLTIVEVPVGRHHAAALAVAWVGATGDTPEGGDRVSYVLGQGAVRLVVTGATERDSPVAEFVRLHGDSVRDIALTAHDHRGTASIPAFGDTVHTLLDAASSHDADLAAPVESVAQTAAARPLPPVGLVTVDHIAVSVAAGARETVAARYEQELGFERLGSPTESIDLGQSAFTMSSVRSLQGAATFVFAEPAADRPSQIADFLLENGGPGVHHVAFATTDIVRTATALEARQVRMLRVPDSYYQQARERLGTYDLPWDELERLGILVDSDEDGLLLQAFTDPIGDRPTLYFEIIQRVGATGFGTENVRALYHAVVLQTPRR